MARTVVDQGVRRIEAEAIDAELVDPVSRVLDEEARTSRLYG